MDIIVMATELRSQRHKFNCIWAIEVHWVTLGQHNHSAEPISQDCCGENWGKKGYDAALSLYLFLINIGIAISIFMKTTMGKISPKCQTEKIRVSYCWQPISNLRMTSPNSDVCFLILQMLNHKTEEGYCSRERHGCKGYAIIKWIFTLHEALSSNPTKITGWSQIF